VEIGCKLIGFEDTGLLEGFLTGVAVVVNTGDNVRVCAVKGVDVAVIDGTIGAGAGR
jgi:hypothetical protein